MLRDVSRIRDVTRGNSVPVVYYCSTDWGNNLCLHIYESMKGYHPEIKPQNCDLYPEVRHISLKFSRSYILDL